jgi:PAS domain S-box-containing protein
LDQAAQVRAQPVARGLVRGQCEVLDSSWKQARDRTTAGSGACMSWVGATYLFVVVGVAYFLAARLSLALLTAPDGVAAFWPAAGVAAGTMLALGPAARLPVAAAVATATIVANLTGDRNLPAAIVFALCNAGEATLIAVLIGRQHGPRFAVDSLSRVLGFFLATVVATALSGVGGAAGFVLFHGSEAPVLTTWFNWFASDALGVVAVAPLVIGIVRILEDPPDLGKLVEGVCILAVLALASMAGFGWPTGRWPTILPLAIVLPLLIWPAARCPPVFAAAAVCIVELVIVGTMTFGVGRLGDTGAPLSHRLLVAQSALVAVSTCALVVAALFAERRSHEALLSSSNEQLRTQERSFRQLLGSLPAAIHTTDSAGRITYCNRAAVDLWGVGPELGKDKCSDLGRLYYPDGTLVPPDECPTKVCLTAGRAMEGKEVILERRDGTRIPIIPYPAPLTDEYGRVVGVVSLKIDVTERKRAETVLAERDAQLALAGRAGLVGSFTYDTDTEIMQISEGYAVIHGLPEGTAKVARSKCLARVHPEDRARIGQLRSDTFSSRSREYTVEYRISRPGHETRWVETRCFIAYHGNGHPQRVVGVTIDITERKGTEAALAERNAQFALASKVALVGSHAYDYVTGITTLSPGTAAIYGLPEDTVELSRTESRALVHPDDLSRLEEEIRQAVEKQRREIVSEFRVARANDRETRWIETRNVISYDDAARPLRMTGVSIDVSERKQSENHKALLIAELDHRVKNALACVTAIAQHASVGSRTTDEFLSALYGRIQSLANAHTLLSKSHWQGVDVAELVRTELAPCGSDGNTVIEGPEVGLTPDAAQTVAMVLHELATNAAKYGALSNRVGQVSVRWRRQSNGAELPGLILEWREMGGPPPGPTCASGYGTGVIRDLIPYELGGTVDYVHAPTGVRCRLKVPAKWLTGAMRRQPDFGTRPRAVAAG